MGLDIYFMKAKKADFEKYENEMAEFKKLTREEKEKSGYPQLDSIDIGYFRKVNFLMAYFDYDDNCTFKPIRISLLKELERVCKVIIDAVEKAKEKCTGDGWLDVLADYGDEYLPTESGFFFGDTDYNEGYYYDVNKVYAWVGEVIPAVADDEVVLMYCWY